MARPRSEEAHNKVLEAALGLFSERGIDATSMDAIAASSGVSKATIYKHWPDKDALALEVLCWLHGLNEKPPVFDSGVLRTDLIAALSYQPGHGRMEIKERMMPHLLAYSARNQVFGKAWRERVIGQQRAQLKLMMERGATSGELDNTINPDIAVAFLIGPMLYRHIFVVHKSQDKAPRDFIEQVVDAFLRSFRPNNPVRQPAKGRSRRT